MTKLVWDQIGKKYYRTGVEQCALYQQDSAGAYPLGVAWDGLTKVAAKPSGAEKTDKYANNSLYLSIVGPEKYAGSISAYSYPVEFELCDGTSQPIKGIGINLQSRKPFGLAYKTLVGNDTEGNDYGYILNLVYGCTATPSETENQTINESTEPIEFTWEFSSVPTKVTGFKPTSKLEIKSNDFDVAKVKALEDILYGTETNPARLPLPDEVIALLKTKG